MMKVIDLIGVLQSQDPQALVLLAADGEGNAYLPMDTEGAFTDGFYHPAMATDGDFYTVEEDKDQIPSDAVPAVVLWPMGAPEEEA